MKRSTSILGAAALLALLAGCGGGSSSSSGGMTMTSSSSPAASAADSFTQAVLTLAAGSSETTVPVGTDGYSVTVVDDRAPQAIN